MEGPSIVLLKEEFSVFKGCTIITSSGSSRIKHEDLQGETIRAFKSWGKHFLIELKKQSIRIHFLMFGSYRVNEKKDLTPRLTLELNTGDQLNFYSSAVQIIEEKLDEVYDWSSDVLSPVWDAKKARKKLKASGTETIGDLLLDQNIFSGVGNIIRNEVLFRARVHPDSIVNAIPPRKLTELITEARQYSFDFYHWKKLYQLKKHWKIYTKKKCPRCDLPAVKLYTGKSKRRSFFCANCQKLYA